MKKLALIALICTSIINCTSVDEPFVRNETTKSNPFERTPEDAIKSVQEFLSHSSGARSLKQDRTIDKLIHLDRMSSLRSTSDMSEFSQKFYAVEFKDSKGYAIVSKDLRTFPIFAILDSGRVNDGSLNLSEMRKRRSDMISGFDSEIKIYNEALGENNSHSRFSNADASKNTENSINNFLKDGWAITRQTDIRLSSKWNQHVSNNRLFMNSFGAPYSKVYEGISLIDEASDIIGPDKLLVDLPLSFGCTPLAFGQVMYALREEKGFKDLKYTSGEPILWDLMTDYGSHYNKECQRFLGWITMNCSPTIMGSQTMVFNIDATKFLRKTMGGHIKSRYDNCIVGDGDFDGYGWSEDKRVAEEFFQYPKCFVIMTASAGAFNYINYHTFVIDGMVEFKKRMKGSGFLGTGLFRKTHNGVRHLYHVNAGWSGKSDGYYLYVQSVNDEFEYTGSNDVMDYRSKVAYLIVRPS